MSPIVGATSRWSSVAGAVVLQAGKVKQMSNPLHAAYYADDAHQYDVTVLERRVMGRDTYLVRFACPEMAAKITPGQFLMVRAPHSDPLLGRAFAMYDVNLSEDGASQSIAIVFHVVGKMTRLLSLVKEGDPLVIWGPLGNGFAATPTDHLLMVAGGIGQTPFLALAREYLGAQVFGNRTAPKASRVTLLYGARSRDLLACVPDFEHAGVAVEIATDDGSAGHHGLVTDLLGEKLASSADSADGLRVVCCGPEPMMQAVAELCIARDFECEVSLETPMACGMGICFSCVAKVLQPDGSWDFKRTCVDGPIFDAKSLVW